MQINNKKRTIKKIVKKIIKGIIDIIKGIIKKELGPDRPITNIKNVN